jgi:hypothetical protein
VLIALGRDRRALTAAYQYLIMGSIGATFIVIGIGFLYLMTGTLNLADMALRIREVENTRPVLVALAFLTVGISLKLALFPLHQWLPNAYTYAPSAVTAFLAATATKVSVYVLIRFYFSVFGESLVFDKLPLPQIMLWLSLIAMFGASAIAIFQDNLKRLFAYSSVGQIGYITLGLSFDSVHGLTASIVHLFNHGIAKGAIFLLIGGLVIGIARSGSTSGAVSPAPTFDRLAGLAKRMPLTSFGIVIGGLSLIGVPGHGRLHQQVVPDRRRDGKGPVLAGRRHPAEFAAGRRLCLALRRSRLFPCAAGRTGITLRSAAGTAAAGLAAGHCDDLVRPRYLAHRRLRARRRATTGEERTMSAHTAILAALLLPLIGALGIALAGRVPNLREGITLVTSVRAVRLRRATARSRTGGQAARTAAVRAAARTADSLPRRAAGHDIRADCLGPVDRQFGLFHRLHARQPGEKPDALLRLLCAVHRPHWRSPSPPTC